MRYEGVARCSRTFWRNGAALVVLSTLGPGVVRGDALEISGTVGPGAHLIVTEQSATRVLGGAASSRIDAAWNVLRGATLELCPEPIIAQLGGDALISTTVDCAPDATVVMRDLASVTSATRLRLRTLVRIAGRDSFYDSLELGADAPPAIGTIAIIGRSVDLQSIDAVASSTQLRIGVGVLPAGLFVRVLGPSVWPVREALDAVRALLWQRMPDAAEPTAARASLSLR